MYIFDKRAMPITNQENECLCSSLNYCYLCNIIERETDKDGTWHLVGPHL